MGRTLRFIYRATAVSVLLHVLSLHSSRTSLFSASGNVVAGTAVVERENQAETRDRHGSSHSSSLSSHTDDLHRRLFRRLYGTSESVPRIAVYSSAEDGHAIGRKQAADLSAMLPDDSVILEHVFYTADEQRLFMEQYNCGRKAIQRFDEFRASIDSQAHLAVEVWKYCALSLEISGIDAALYVDSHSPLLTRLQYLLSHHGQERNVAVLGDLGTFPNTINSALLYLLPSQRYIAKAMLEAVVETPIEVLEVNPLLLAKKLYKLIQKEIRENVGSDQSILPGFAGDGWLLLEQACRMEAPLRRSEDSAVWTKSAAYRWTHQCPAKTGFCCTLTDTTTRNAIMISQHPIMPPQRLPDLSPRPYNAETGHYEEDEVAFLTVVREQVLPQPAVVPESPNFYDILQAKDCLPADDTCSHCLRNKKGADCHVCAEACPCYCQALCRDTVPAKHIAKEWTVTPPLYHRDPNRLIPRIIHQTWMEELTRDKYPNMSRLVESFRRSGWEYKFYSDDAAASFISTHFPAEVRQAYDALKPGAFKADLFRYCVLLIHGGIYADVDVHLESFLDRSIPPDVGFMVPLDEPGKPVRRQVCLWNGLIAAAPGHPILAKAIETVVNQVRNRFTSVDIDATFCPNPELSILHAYDTLFTAGPCLLGATLNRVLGRHGQTPLASGEIFPWTSELRDDAIRGTSFVLGTDPDPKFRLPGRTIILHQNKWDMGAHRFTFLEENLVVAATDLPDSNDREALEAEGKTTQTTEHYSKTHAKHGVYGVENLYVDKYKANEEIRIYVDWSKHIREEMYATA